MEGGWGSQESGGGDTSHHISDSYELTVLMKTNNCMQTCRKQGAGKLGGLLIYPSPSRSEHTEIRAITDLATPAMPRQQLITTTTSVQLVLS